MMQKTLILAAVVVGAIMWKRGKEREAAKSKIEEATHKDGTNWTGDMWGRLNGADDLKAPVSRNLDDSINADPGRIGQSAVGLQPSWNGSLQ